MIRAFFVDRYRKGQGIGWLFGRSIWGFLPLQDVFQGSIAVSDPKLIEQN
jgi:hypothetical protein